MAELAEADGKVKALKTEAKRRNSVEGIRAQQAEQDRKWREQGHAEQGGSRAGWGLA